MSNQEFCYWLQGYFEIAGESSDLDKKKITKIMSMLNGITEPLGLYTSWLKNTLKMFKDLEFHKPLIMAFTIVIKDELNFLFTHVIDDSYDTDLPKSYLQHIHDTGEIAF